MWPLLVLCILCSWTPVLLCCVVLLTFLNHHLSLLIPRSRTQRHLENALSRATSYTAWAAAGRALDARDAGARAWRDVDASPVYDWRGVAARVDELAALLATGDVDALAWRLGLCPVRHFCNVTDPRLYARLRVGTKALVERLVDVSVLAVKMVAEYPAERSSVLTEAMKLESLEAPRVAIGKTALILQAGSIFGLCHLGVVKELLHHGLLPRTVAGTKSGAIIAALVGVHSDEELISLLDRDGLNLDAFARSHKSHSLSYLLKRLFRLLTTGYALDREVLTDCLRANIGDVTFEEAFHRTRKPLNITITCDDIPTVPNLLNYMTAPNVVIWSAAMASSDMDQISAIRKIRAKDDNGAIVDWSIVGDPSRRPRLDRRSMQELIDTTTPLNRMRELFNVNHFIISQARPYLVSLLSPSFKRLHYPGRPDWTWTEGAVWMLTKEIKHRIRQAHRLGAAPAWALRFLDDELMEESTFHRQPRGEAAIIDSITLVPELAPSDFARLLRDPSRAEIDDWILRGQRSVWPAVAALEVRCGFEAALEYYYQMLRAQNPGVDGGTPTVAPVTLDSDLSEDEDGYMIRREHQAGRRRTRRRSYSLSAL